jgi:hypothetical protein
MQEVVATVSGVQQAEAFSEQANRCITASHLSHWDMIFSNDTHVSAT